MSKESGASCCYGAIAISFAFLLIFVLFCSYTMHSIDVRQADNTYKLATDYGERQTSGSYHFGGGGSKDARSATKLQELWEELEQNTRCTYSDVGDDLP